MAKKILIIRFSSFGDIIQCLNIIPDLQGWTIHWLCRQEFSSLLKSQGSIDKVIGFNRKSGVRGLVSTALEIRKENYDVIYDAHANLRSRLLKTFVRPLPFLGVKWITRSKERMKRFFLFKLGINFFPNPYKGMMSYRFPLAKIGLSGLPKYQKSWSLPDIDGKYKGKIVLCPSAAWEMKRWPISSYVELMRILPNHHFVVLGGPDDQFCKVLKDQFPHRVEDLVGKLSLVESCSVVANASVVVSADSGLIHVAEILGVPGISMIGPTAFGFPTLDNIKTLEVDMKCRPCSKDGRGNCSDKVWQKCMVDIEPQIVAETINQVLKTK